MSQVDDGHSPKKADISEVEGDDVALNVIGPDTARPKFGELKRRYFLMFLLFQLVITFVLFFIFSAKPQMAQTPSTFGPVPNTIFKVVPASLNLTKVATIIETRKDPSLVSIILHFASVLGDEWPFKIFCSPDNKYLLDDSFSIQKHVKSGRFEIIVLPADTSFANRPEVTAFLTKKSFWEQLAPADHILLFQLDSMICANSKRSVDEFLKYDWVGAPWPWDKEGGGGNGGLSVRNRKKILEAIDKWPGNPTNLPEDVYYSVHLKELPGSVMPTYEISGQFSSELVYTENPVGYHQPYRYHMDKMNEIEAYCPEVKLITQHYIPGRL